MSGFNTAITNTAGTVNLENVTMTGNTTDVQNDKNLNLKGTDVFDTIAGAGDTVITTYTDVDGNKVKGDVTVNNTLTQKTVALETSDDKLTNKGIATVDSLTNNGTIDNTGTFSVKGGKNSGTISGDAGVFNVDGAFTNESEITQKSVTVTDNTSEDNPFVNNGSVDSNTFTNNGYTNNGSSGTISADVINNKGTLITNASNITSKNGKSVK